MHCTLSDERIAVVKYINNIQGNLVLINEFVSYEIAKLIGVNTPVCGLCILDQRTTYGAEYLRNIELDSDITIDTNNYGVCFFSEYIPYTVPYNPAALRRMTNIDNFQLMIIFDHIIYNKDRHIGNILIDYNNKRFYVIDHSHVFKNQCIWDAMTFKQGIANKDYLDKDIVNFNQDTYVGIWNTQRFDLDLAKKQSENIVKLLTPDKISDIINRIPNQWKQLVNNNDLRELEKYLNYRISNLENIVNTIYEAKEELFYEKG